MFGHRCKDCGWFDNQHESLKLIRLVAGKYEIGYCRKHFPIPSSLEGHFWGNWPLTDINDFCGEFRKQE